MNRYENHTYLSDCTTTGETISDQFQKANVKNKKNPKLFEERQDWRVIPNDRVMSLHCDLFQL